jgi:hypothetical protein
MRRPAAHREVTAMRNRFVIAPVGVHDAVWSQAAAILGLPPERLADAFDQAHRQALDDAGAAGQLTRPQADWTTRHREAMRPAGGPGAGPWTMGRGVMGGRFAGGYGPPWSAR